MMNKFYEIRGEAYELVEDGRLVNPITQRIFWAGYVERVIEHEAREINDLEMWCEARAAKLHDKIFNLEAYLQYADGPAYYQDKQKIADGERELALVEKYLAENF
jgi:hypothetical protein